jgi:hypothetical protein
MKNLLFIFALVLSISFAIHAQVKLTVTEDTRSMSKGSHNAFVMEVPQTKASELKKEWEKYLKDNAKVKPEEFKGELFVLGAIINRIASESLNHYALFNENPSGGIITAFYAIQDSFVSSAGKPAVAGNISKFMYDFGKEVYTKAVEEELKVEQKTLKNKEKELEDLMKDEDKEAKNSRTKIK